MPKMGSRGPKRYIFGDQFCSKNARKLRFHLFLHFNARKHMIRGLNPREICEFGTKFTISFELGPLQVK